MCDEGREKRAMHEVYELLMEDLKPVKVEESPPTIESSNDKPQIRPLTVAEELAKELEEVGGELGGASGKDGEAGKEQSATAIPAEKLQSRLALQPARFMDIETRAMGLLWVTEPDFDVVSWVDSLFAKAAGSGMVSTRYVSRIIPIQSFITADIGSIAATVKELFASLFPPTVARETTYKVELRIRNSGKLDKEKGSVMEAIGKAVGSRHLVSLDEPQTVVLVEVVKHLACVALVTERRWQKLSKFNVRVNSETAEQRESRMKAAAALQMGNKKQKMGGKEEGEGGGQQPKPVKVEDGTEGSPQGEEEGVP